MTVALMFAGFPETRFGPGSERQSSLASVDSAAIRTVQRKGCAAGQGRLGQFVAPLTDSSSSSLTGLVGIRQVCAEPDTDVQSY